MSDRDLRSIGVGQMKVFRGIKELVTCSGVALKSARRTRESDLNIIKNAAIIESGGQIVWVGKEKDLTKQLTKELAKEGAKDLAKQLAKDLAKDLAKPNKAGKSGLSKNGRSKTKKKKIQEIDLKADTVMPGFIDCHTHMVFAGNRIHEFELRNSGVSYAEIAERGGGIKYTVAQTAKLPEQKLLDLAESRAEKFLRQGVTTVEVKSGYGLSQDAEIKILKVISKIKGVRTVATYLGPHAIPVGRSANDYLDEIINSTLPKIKKMDLADRVDIYIEKNYFDPEQAERYFKVAKNLGFRVTAHLDQLSHSGASNRFKQWEPESLDHMVYSNSEDFSVLSRLNTTCVLLPTSDFYLRMKYPDARAMIDSGLRVALATDYNPGTSPSQDLNFVGILARLEMKMTLPEVIGALTMGSAYALSLNEKLGSIEPGKICDFVVHNGSWSDLFYEVGNRSVCAVYRSGVNVF